MFLLASLIPACDSSSWAFHMMHSAYKLNKQGGQYIGLSYFFPNFEPVSCSMSGSNCCFLTHVQVSQETGEWSVTPISLSREIYLGSINKCFTVVVLVGGGGVKLFRRP